MKIKHTLVICFLFIFLINFVIAVEDKDIIWDGTSVGIVIEENSVSKPIPPAIKEQINWIDISLILLVILALITGYYYSHSKKIKAKNKNSKKSRSRKKHK